MKQNNNFDTRHDCGLIPPATVGDGATKIESTAETLRREIQEMNPRNQAEKEVSTWVNAGLKPGEIISLLCLRIAGLTKAESISVVNGAMDCNIDAGTFKIDYAIGDLGDAPPEVKRDPHLERILNARKDIERLLPDSESLSQLATIAALRNGITVEEANQIIGDLSGNHA